MLEYMTFTYLVMALAKTQAFVVDELCGTHHHEKFRPITLAVAPISVPLSILAGVIQALFPLPIDFE